MELRQRHLYSVHFYTPHNVRLNYLVLPPHADAASRRLQVLAAWPYYPAEPSQRNCSHCSIQCNCTRDSITTTAVLRQSHPVRCPASKQCCDQWPHYGSTHCMSLMVVLKLSVISHSIHLHGVSLMTNSVWDLKLYSLMQVYPLNQYPLKWTGFPVFYMASKPNQASDIQIDWLFI